MRRETTETQDRLTETFNLIKWGHKLGHTLTTHKNYP